MLQRGRWLQSAGLVEEAFGACTVASSLLAQEWEQEALRATPLLLWLQVSYWRKAVREASCVKGGARGAVREARGARREGPSTHHGCQCAEGCRRLCALEVGGGHMVRARIVARPASVDKFGARAQIGWSKADMVEAV